jgi:hypothetical protein
MLSFLCCLFSRLRCGSVSHSDPTANSGYSPILQGVPIFYLVSNCKCMYLLIRVAARSKAWIVFVRMNSGIVGSNLTQNIDVIVHLFWACVVLCAGSGLTTCWSPAQGVLPTVYIIKKLKKWLQSHRERELELLVIILSIIILKNPKQGHPSLLRSS